MLSEFLYLVNALSAETLATREYIVLLCETANSDRAGGCGAAQEAWRVRSSECVRKLRVQSEAGI